MPKIKKKSGRKGSILPSCFKMNGVDGFILGAGALYEATEYVMNEQSDDLPAGFMFIELAFGVNIPFFFRHCSPRSM
jgi:hypothetical protein